MERIARGDFLRRAGALALGLGAFAPVRPWWAPARAEKPTDPRVRELAKALHGEVVGRAASAYPRARRLFNTRFDGVRPLAIAYCETLEDVQKAVRWARKHGVRIAARAGGHSYGGYSTTPGVVVDVTRLSRIRKNGRTAAIGAGASLIDVYEALWEKRVTIPAGSCPTVGVAGLALGGGHGFLSRKYGMTSDNVLSLTIVTADGKARVCSEAEHEDLFWACRGGGGGNFGIVTGFRFRVHPVGDVATFVVDWPWSQAGAALAAWQRWAPHAPDGLFSVFSLSAAGRGGTPRVRAVGQLVGSRERLTSLIQPLANTGTPTRVAVRARPYFGAVQMWAGCAGSVDECHLAPEGTLARATFAGKSDYARRPLSKVAMETVVRGIEARSQARARGQGILLLDSYGGAVNRVPKAATAFVHRDALFSFQYLAYWEAGEPPSVAAANLKWLRGFHAAMRPYVSGLAYANYVDPDLKDALRAYYGSNLKRLVAVKRRYDPKRLFRFAQGIPPRL